ncbi:MAG: LysM peptidoglycan-binding domain-containing protein [Thermoflexales bacterium]|nr:LysM peptidoglycan-binding domain-containing protein [Thermoflexales bacterium]
MEEQAQVKLGDTQPRVCPSCGGKVSSRAKTCTLCGIDLEISLAPVVEEEPQVPVKPPVSLKNIVIQFVLTVLGLGLLAGIVLGFMTIVQGASQRAPTVTPTLSPTPLLLPTFTPTGTPTATPTPDPRATPLPPIEHKVQAGDTLSVLAREYDTTVELIIKFNNLDSDIIQVGQVLLMPAAGATAATLFTPIPSTGGDRIIHVVQAGETLLGIAQRYDVRLSVIQQLNDIDDPEMIKEGQQLYIPIGPTATATSGPSPTPTPVPKYPSPPLLSPLERAEFAGAEAAILLQWAATTILHPDEWYQVTIEQIAGSDQQLLSLTTKSSSLRVPVELYPTQAEKQRLFKWRVDIVRQTNDTPAYEQASLPGDSRTFWWVQPPPTATATAESVPTASVTPTQTP